MDSNYSTNYLNNSFGHEFNENFVENFHQHEQHQPKTQYDIPLQGAMFEYDGISMSTNNQVNSLIQLRSLDSNITTLRRFKKNYFRTLTHGITSIIRETIWLSQIILKTRRQLQLQIT